MIDLNYHRRDLDTLLYLVFNAGTLLFTKTPLCLLLSKINRIEGMSLSREELIAETGILRKRLYDNVNSVDFEILQMFFQSTNDVEASFVRYENLIPMVIKEAKILANHCDHHFAILCCLSFAWKKNLFTSKNFGPYYRWYPRTSFYRKRSMLSTALDKMRKKAMINAEKVLAT